MNQEYITILHVVNNRRVAFVAVGEGKYAEEEVSHLEEFVKTYVKAEHVNKVLNRLYSKLNFVTDYDDNIEEVLTK